MRAYSYCLESAALADYNWLSKELRSDRVAVMSNQDQEHATPPASEDAGVATSVAPVRKPAAPARKPRQLPPYKVLLHNDDVNTFEHVIKSIRRLTTLSTEDALLKALEAHDAGVSLLLVTHRERAELFAEQFASLSMTVSIEPAEA